MICENCGNEHNGSYGNGRFCSESCAHQFSGRHNDTTKLKEHLDKLHTSRRSEYGRWKCNLCGEVFESRSILRKHKSDVHNFNLFKDENTNECKYCHRIFKSKQALYSHSYQCKLSPFYSKDLIEDKNKKESKTLHARITSGEILPSFKGRTHSDEAKKKMRESTRIYLEKTIGQVGARYNIRSIEYFDKLSVLMKWNLQHAENGGEFYFGGYWLDAYDKEKNIVVEYDEREHYKDVYKNILKDKDVYRQNYIIEHLKCKFYRYNETTNVLWCVN